MFRSNTIKNFNDGLRYLERVILVLDTCLILNNTLDLYGEGAWSQGLLISNIANFLITTLISRRFLSTGGGMNDFYKIPNKFLLRLTITIINTESGIHTHIDLPDTVSPPSVEITNNTIKSIVGE